MHGEALTAHWIRPPHAHTLETVSFFSALFGVLTVEEVTSECVLHFPLTIINHLLFCHLFIEVRQFAFSAVKSLNVLSFWSLLVGFVDRIGCKLLSYIQKEKGKNETCHPWGYVFIELRVDLLTNSSDHFLT